MLSDLAPACRGSVQTMEPSVGPTSLPCDTRTQSSPRDHWGWSSVRVSSALSSGVANPSCATCPTPRLGDNGCVDVAGIQSHEATPELSRWMSSLYESRVCGSVGPSHPEIAQVVAPPPRDGGPAVTWTGTAPRGVPDTRTHPPKGPGSALLTPLTLASGSQAAVVQVPVAQAGSQWGYRPTPMVYSPYSGIWECRSRLVYSEMETGQGPLRPGPAGTCAYEAVPNHCLWAVVAHGRGVGPTLGSPRVMATTASPAVPGVTASGVRQQVNHQVPPTSVCVGLGTTGVRQQVSIPLLPTSDSAGLRTNGLLQHVGVPLPPTSVCVGLGTNGVRQQVSIPLLPTSVSASLLTSGLRQEPVVREATTSIQSTSALSSTPTLRPAILPSDLAEWGVSFHVAAKKPSSARRRQDFNLSVYQSAADLSVLEESGDEVESKESCMVDITDGRHPQEAACKNRIIPDANTCIARSGGSLGQTSDPGRPGFTLIQISRVPSRPGSSMSQMSDLGSHVSDSDRSGSQWSRMSGNLTQPVLDQSRPGSGFSHSSEQDSGYDDLRCHSTTPPPSYLEPPPSYLEPPPSYLEPQTSYLVPPTCYLESQTCFMLRSADPEEDSPNNYSASSSASEADCHSEVSILLADNSTGLVGPPGGEPDPGRESSAPRGGRGGLPGDLGSEGSRDTSQWESSVCSDSSSEGRLVIESRECSDEDGEGAEEEEEEDNAELVRLADESDQRRTGLHDNDEAFTHVTWAPMLPNYGALALGGDDGRNTSTPLPWVGPGADRLHGDNAHIIKNWLLPAEQISRVVQVQSASSTWSQAVAWQRDVTVSVGNKRKAGMDPLGESTEDRPMKRVKATTFQNTTRKVHRKMWWKNLKMKLILALVILVILTVIIIIILYSTHVLPPKPGGTTTTTTTTTTAPPAILP